MFVLNFYSPVFIDQLRRGRKTATIRLGDKGKKYRKGEVVLGLGSRWGVLRYWWVAAKLAISLVLLTLVVVSLRFEVADQAARAKRLAVDTSGPPELPGFRAASVWIRSSISRPVLERRERPSAEITPLVTVASKPSGLPMATTTCACSTPSVTWQVCRPKSRPFTQKSPVFSWARAL